MRVLVVDDHPLILDALCASWPQIMPGTEVRTAHDRAEAEIALDDDPEIALVLLDLALPGTRGLDFLADLKLGITLRETDVLKGIVQGKPNKLICRDLRMSEGTCKVHVSSILRKLRVRSRTQAVAELARRGISVEMLELRR